MAELSGIELDDSVPETWRSHVRSRLDCEPPHSMGALDRFDSPTERAQRVLALTAERIKETRAAVFPHHGLVP